MKGNYPTISVRWLDHFSTDEWTHIPDHNPKASPVTTKGFLIKETDDIISISHSIGEDDMAACTMNILKVNIISRSDQRGRRRRR